MPTLTATDGAELFYRDHGDGPVVVLLQGLAADVEVDWERSGIAPALRAGGFRTVLVDQPSEDRAASTITALLDALGAAHVALVGYSASALAVLHLVPDEPRVSAIVVGGVGAHTLATPGQPAIALERITVPTLVIAGEDDELAGDPYALAHQLPNAEARHVPGDHTTALHDPTLAGETVRFLSHHLH